MKVNNFFLSKQNMSHKSVKGLVGKYKIHLSHPIGHGSSGTVFEGINNDTGKKVAAKQLVIEKERGGRGRESMIK